MYKNKSWQKFDPNPKAEINMQGNSILLEGAWTWTSISERNLLSFKNLNLETSDITLDGGAIDDLDIAGGYLINKIIKRLQNNHKINLVNFSDNHRLILEDILELKIEDYHKKSIKLSLVGMVKFIGSYIFSLIAAIGVAVAFFGHFCSNFAKWLIRPWNLAWGEVTQTIDDAGFKSLFIVSSLCFLIGITLAYEMSPQFVTYGANIYVVNFLGIALLKEVVPLLSAIVLSGRTGGAIAASIGTMRVQEEVDALQVMGVSPMSRLILPRIIGVIIALPLVTSIADAASMFGGSLIANYDLNISFHLFFQRLQSQVSINNYAGGMIKSFFFAIAIALVGCYCGLNVKGDAMSIGTQTTKSVVMGIVFIVSIDAIFAILFNIFKF